MTFVPGLVLAFASTPAAARIKSVIDAPEELRVLDGVVSHVPRTPRVQRHTPSVHVSARWSIPWQGILVHAVPLGDRMVLASTLDGHGTYTLLATATGRIEKERVLEGCTPRPAPESTMLLASCDDGDLVLLDPETLEPRWRTELGGGVVAVSAAGDRLFATTRHDARGELFALNVDGEIAWRAEVPATHPLFISEDPTRVYVYETDPTVWGFERDTGQLLWSYPTEQNIHDVNPAADGTLEVVQADGLVTLSGKSGRVLRGPVVAPDDERIGMGPWRYRVTAVDTEETWFRPWRLELRNPETDDAWTYAAPIYNVEHVTGDALYACSQTGILHVLDVATGAPRWWADVGHACDLLPVRPSPDGPEWQLALVEDRLLAFDPSRPQTSKATVTVSGRFLDVDEVPKGGVRVWIGDQSVITNAKGRFRAKVPVRSVYSVTIDPRDTEGETDPVVIVGGESRHLEVSAYYESG